MQRRLTIAACAAAAVCLAALISAAPARLPEPDLAAVTVVRSPTARPLPTDTLRRPGRTPTPPRTATPRPTSTPIPLRRGDLNILLLGCDEANPSWRTDVIVVVAVRPSAGVAAMLSVPRDLWVEIPGYGMERINAADYMGERRRKGGGPRLVAQTLERNLGIPVHAYVRVRIEGLIRIVDALGGIEVDVDRPYPDAGIAPGRQHMDGRTVLAYVRTRKGTNDLDRTRREQQVLMGIRDAALRLDVLRRLPALTSALGDAIETDLSPLQVLSLIRLAYRLKPEAYRLRTFDETMVEDWVTPGGAQVLLFDRARVEEVWAELTAVRR